MKNQFLSALVISTLAFYSCESNTPKETDAKITDAKTVEQPAAGAEVYAIDTNASSFQWEGHKKIDIGKRHHGTVHLKDGQVMILNNRISAGKFVMDMHSINDVDLEGKDDVMQTKLVTHLKSADFFDVEKYPVSTFEITSVKDSTVGENNTWLEGNLTIKEKTQNIGFPAKVSVDENEAKAKARARVVIDRSKFDVRYGSENFFKDMAGDKIISNDITLEIDLVAKKAQP